MTKGIFDIYIMKVPDGMIAEDIYPAERREYILSSSSDKTRLQRYGAWKALEKAINDSFGLQITDINFHYIDGKWQSDRLYFSLSHTDSAVAVAVSSNKCGIDIEAISRFIKRYNSSEILKKFEKKICSEKENLSLDSPRDFIELWTKKESIYKCYGSGAFSAKSINTQNYKTVTESITLDEEFIISCCGDNIENYRIFII